MRISRRLEQAFTSPLFSYKELRSMYLTLVLDQFFIAFINVLSTSMVSSTGEAAIAAVSMVGTINAMVSLLFTSLATGGSIVIARSKGSRQADDMRRAIGEATGLCCLTALLLSGLLIVLGPTLVGWLYPRVEPLLVTYSIQYLRLVAISCIPYSVFCAVFNCFRALGDTRSSLVLTIVINGAHLIFSMLFINGLQLGVAGSGLSLITARVIGMVLALYWLMVRHNELGVQPRHFFCFTRRLTKEIFSLGAPIAMESVLMQGGMLLVQVYLARLTTTELAAHSVATSIMNLYYTPGNALTALVSTVCGQCIGAKQYELTRQYCLRFIRAGRGITLVSSALLFACTPLLMRLYQATEQAQPILWQILALAAVAMPILWCSSYVPPMALRAAGDALYCSIVSSVALGLGRCAVGYVLTIGLGLGVPGVWIGMVLEWLGRAIVLRLRLNGQRWLISFHQ